MRFSALFSVAVLSLGLAQSALAAGVTIKPAQVEDRVDPGATKTIIMQVMNGDAATKTFYPVIRNISGVDDGQHPIFVEPKVGEELSDVVAWASFKKDPIAVAPGSTGLVEVTIRVPKDASPGSHFAGFFFSDKPVAGEFLGASVGYDVGSIFHLQVAGVADAKASIRSFSTAKSVYTHLPVDLAVAVMNEGNTLVRPVGLVQITNMFGRRVADLNVNDTGAGVFPKTTREWPLKWDSNEIVFGKFTASVALSVDLNDGAHTLSRNVEFWVLPSNILMPLIVGFLVFVTVSYIVLRLYVKREVRRAKIAGVRGGSKKAEGLSMFASVTIALLLSAIIALLLIFFYFG